MMYPFVKYPPSSRYFRRGYLLDGNMGAVIDGIEISETPQLGKFFRPPRNEDWTVWKAANTARHAAGLTSNYTYKTIKAIAASPFNKSHIAYTNKGYENYPFKGPQFLRLYGPTLLAQKGTGKDYPVMWIPNPDAPSEPAVTTGPPAVTPVTTPVTPVPVTPTPVTPTPTTPVTTTPVTPVPVTPTPPTVIPVTPTTPVTPTPTGPDRSTIMVWVRNAINEYFKQNPLPESGLNRDAVMAIVQAAISSFPIKAAIAEYFNKNPLPEGGITREQVLQLIDMAISKIKPAQGIPGPIGPQGPAGPPATIKASQIQDAVNQYFSENPLPSGGLPPDAVQEMINNAVANISREEVTINQEGKSDAFTSFLSTIPLFAFVAKL